MFTERILVHAPSRRPTLDQMLTSQWITHITHIEQMNNQKSTKRSSFFFSSHSSSSSNDRSHKTKNRRNSRSKDRSPELSHFTTIQCNTKRATSVLADNFLHPIENIQQYEKDDHTSVSDRFPTKRMIFSGNLKKKIGPMEQEKINYTQKSNNEIKSANNDISSHITANNQNDVSNKNSVSSLDMANATGYVTPALSKSVTNLDSTPYDEEQGDFIMLPTCTTDMTHLHLIEMEARRIMCKLGVSSEMLLRAIANGPRSDIIGAYRIIIHRLQKQALLAKQAEIIAQEEMTKPKTTRTCAIL